MILAVVILDFLQWGNHWIRHKIKPFWHFHSIHHSPRELNAFTDLRTHSAEYFIAVTLAFVPMLALGVPPLAVTGVGGFRMWYARFVHANIGTNLGPLKHILVTPQYHRVHHSIEPAHQDKNFASMFTVWDRSFGTLHRNYDEYPATGVRTGVCPTAPCRSRGVGARLRADVSPSLPSAPGTGYSESYATAVVFRPEGKEQPDTTR